MVVEDDDALQLVVAKMLRQKGFSVVSAQDGTAALDLIRAGRHMIDVLLLDISLPGASSREVFSEAHRLIPGIAVIVTTSYSRERAAEALDARVEHLLRKPYRLSALLDLIRQVAT